MEQKVSAFKGTRKYKLRGHSSLVNDCAFSPNGCFIVSASYDKTLKIWDTISGQEKLTLKGHTDSVNACAYSPDGRLIVSASSDKTLRVWDALSGTMRKLIDNTSIIYGCAVSPLKPPIR